VLSVRCPRRSDRGQRTAQVSAVYTTLCQIRHPTRPRYINLAGQMMNSVADLHFPMIAESRELIAGGGTRTHTPYYGYWILNPARLPIPPLRLILRRSLFGWRCRTSVPLAAVWNVQPVEGFRQPIDHQNCGPRGRETDGVPQSVQAGPRRVRVVPGRNGRIFDAIWAWLDVSAVILRATRPARLGRWVLCRLQSIRRKSRKHVRQSSLAVHNGLPFPPETMNATHAGWEGGAPRIGCDLDLVRE